MQCRLLRHATVAEAVVVHIEHQRYAVPDGERPEICDREPIWRVVVLDCETGPAEPREPSCSDCWDKEPLGGQPRTWGARWLTPDLQRGLSRWTEPSNLRSDACLQP